MDEKKYSVVGTVTIGTDEYRDLIENCVQNEASASEYRSKYWKEEEEKKKLIVEVADLKTKLDQFNKYFATTNSWDSFNLWLLKQSYSQEE